VASIYAPQLFETVLAVSSKHSIVAPNVKSRRVCSDGDDVDNNNNNNNKYDNL